MTRRMTCGAKGDGDWAAVMGVDVDAVRRASSRAGKEVRWR